MKRNMIAATIFVVSLFFCQAAASACTLWAATGSRVSGGGSLIAKNHDDKPDYMQNLRVVKPDKGYRYFGLYAVDGTRNGIRAGLNEKGLVVVDAVASSLSQPQVDNSALNRLMTTLLAECSSVDEVVSHTSSFNGTGFLMVADKYKLAVVEIGPEGQVAVRENNEGIMYHTNHYLDGNMITINENITASSQTRYDRIGELLTSQNVPFSLDDFISFSQDESNGEDNSIWRTGLLTDDIRTMATWAVKLPAAGMPELYIKLANPAGRDKTYRVTASQVFNDQLFR